MASTHIRLEPGDVVEFKPGFRQNPCKLEGVLTYAGTYPCECEYDIEKGRHSLLIDVKDEHGAIEKLYMHRFQKVEVPLNKRSDACLADLYREKKAKRLLMFAELEDIRKELWARGFALERAANGGDVFTKTTKVSL